MKRFSLEVILEQGGSDYGDSGETNSKNDCADHRIGC
jgi:hypothetical protein